MMLDDIAYKNKPIPRPVKRKVEDFSDWPEHDIYNKFRPTPKFLRMNDEQGFNAAGIENQSNNEKGLFTTNAVLGYPEIKPMRLTHIGDKNSLYTTGDVEYDSESEIASPVIRGDTSDMHTPILEGTDFDNIRSYSGKYGKPYVPLSQQEKDQLIDNVRDNKYEYNTKLDLLFAKNNTETGKDGLKGYLVRANRPVPILTGDNFDNIQSAGKPRKRLLRMRQTKRKHTHKKRYNRKTKKHTQRNKKRSLRTLRKR